MGCSDAGLCRGFSVMSVHAADPFIPDAMLALITGRSARSIRRWRQQGLLPVRRLGRVHGIMESDLQDLLRVSRPADASVIPDDFYYQ